MRKIYLLLTFVLFSVISKSQEYDMIFQHQNVSNYSDGNLNMLKYTFEASSPLSLRTQQLINNSFVSKNGIKSVKYNANNKSISIITLKEVKIKDLSNTLKQINMLLVYESTSDSDLKKAEYHINNKQ